MDDNFLRIKMEGINTYFGHKRIISIYDKLHFYTQSNLLTSLAPFRLQGVSFFIHRLNNSVAYFWRNGSDNYYGRNDYYEQERLDEKS